MASVLVSPFHTQVTREPGSSNQVRQYVPTVANAIGVTAIKKITTE